MKILQIPVKYQKDDTVYTTKQSKLEKICSICEGTGKIKYNDKDMRCPECMGAGKFTSNKMIHTVCDEPFIIYMTKITVNNNGNIIIKYKGHCGFSNMNRMEESLFLTKEEAQVRCDELNKETIIISIDNIIIQDSFKNTQPSLDKIQKKLEYYKKYNRFDKRIVINKDNVLQDGYITYLICRMLYIKTNKVVVE